LGGEPENVFLLKEFKGGKALWRGTRDFYPNSIWELLFLRKRCGLVWGGKINGDGVYTLGRDDLPKRKAIISSRSTKTQEDNQKRLKI